ncbi:MAG TPA: c-type cytochrome [Gemmatimonadaceae bacterium]|nr:c-type cytochrome [Gemmatimonadaceae bacterium]
MTWRRVALVVAALGCTKAEAERSAAEAGRVAAGTPGRDTAHATSPAPAPDAGPGAPARSPFRIPDESEVQDTALLASIRRGRALLRHTRDSLPHHVGNALVCTNCHLQDGTRQHGMSWVGVYARFPQYRSRAGTTQLIEDRINDCFKRSLNGRPLAPESRDMRDIVAYMAFLSTGYPVGRETEGQGLPRLETLPGDTVRGARVFAARCARCHGVSGGGSRTAPPVWGARSYNIGAGMARVRTAAAFVQRWMPQDSTGVLTPQEAFDVAQYIDSRPRPDFRGKEKDWPHGDPPPDVAYATDAARAKAKASARR